MVEQKNKSKPGHNRFLFHSFPRPTRDEHPDALNERALSILGFMADIGLVLAPELVPWDVSYLSGGAEKLAILQRRICFTELAEDELPDHRKMFGPFALACNIQKLRDSGAMPVIYAPQAITENVVSQLSIFAVRGTYHTHAVLKQLQTLKNASDPVLIAAQTGLPVNPDYTINLRNTGPDGAVVQGADVPAVHVQQVMKHVGFNNIPFDHSIAVLSMFLDMFYPTDNKHTEDELGYYRQREWRFIGPDMAINGHHVARPLKEAERKRLVQVDPHFWVKELQVDEKAQARVDLALVYQPYPDWSWWSAIEKIMVPKAVAAEAENIIAGRAAIEAV